MLTHRIIGHGPLPVLAFHGFGRTSTDFAQLAPALAARCTLHAFDLPFHGDSPAPLERVESPFEPTEFATFFRAYLDHIGVERVALLGYSLGGRIALSLLEHLPERIAQVVLAAPDGLTRRPWYRSLAGTALGRAVYRGFVRYPGPVHGLAHGLRAVGLLDERLHRFVIGQTDTLAARLLLYHVWCCLRRIEPDLDRVAAVLRERDIPLHLFFGSRDRVDPPTLARGLQRRAHAQVHMEVLNAGHNLLGPELGERLAALLRPV